ncbi:MAG: EAL domain-containing protein [Hansschlegelia sp.]
MQPDAPPNAFSRRGLYPLIGVVLVAVLLAIGFLMRTADEQDAYAERRSKAMVEAAIQDRWSLLARTLEDYADWGEAYRHLHIAFSQDWAYRQANMGETLSRRLGFNHVFVIGPDDVPRYAVINGELRDPASAFAAMGGDLIGLARQARAAGSVNKTVVKTGVSVVGGDPALAAAGVVSLGGDPTIKAIAGPASVIIFAEQLSPAYLAKLGSDRFVGDLRVARTADDRAATPRKRLAVTGSEEGFVLRWTPDQPGARFMATALPSLIGGVSALLIAFGLILRMSTRAERFVESSAKKLEQAYRDAERQALHDPTTGLPNRAMLARHVEAVRGESGADFAMLFLDLDRFKPVNDAHGHAAGDQVLRAVARRLTSRVGPCNLVARVGGDEFAAVVAETDRERIGQLCELLIKDIAEPIRHTGGEARIGLSIGVVHGPARELDVEELLRRADLALYRAKESGRGVYCFYQDEMSERTRSRRALEGELWNALERGELYLDYQPRYDAQTLRMRRVEALLRWRHPVRGLVSPGEFVPLAEECGLILPIGDWAMRTACKQAAAWPEIGVSVNVSAVQVRGGGLVEATSAALAESGLAPERLEIELTEGVLLEDAARARNMLLDLKTLGVRLSMDDFGTGFSSLGYLRNFPFDAIKIDRGFVADLGTSTDARAIVQAILGLGRALGLSVTAEGVETREQLALLQLDRCNELQGFYLARPQAPELITALLRAEDPSAARPVVPPATAIRSINLGK